jgi:hypothetical protein
MNPPRIDVPYVDWSVQPYVYSFISEAAARGVNINMGDTKVLVMPIKANNSNNLTAGICGMAWGNIVIIDSEFWSFYDSYTKEDVVFHELGHCVLKREHCDAKTKDDKYISMMRTTIPHDNDYIERRKEYIDELFSKSNRCKK